VDIFPRLCARPPGHHAEGSGPAAPLGGRLRAARCETQFKTLAQKALRHAEEHLKNEITMIIEEAKHAR
jgi:hypothetical protein